MSSFWTKILRHLGINTWRGFVETHQQHFDGRGLQNEATIKKKTVKKNAIQFVLKEVFDGKLSDLSQINHLEICET